MDKNLTENNCFWLNEEKNESETDPAHHEVFLYDEAEPLAYGCSDTSMPPKVTSVSSSDRNPTSRDAEITRKPTDKSVCSELLRDASKYYSVQSFPKKATKTEMDGTTRGANEPKKVVENNFQNAILSMYNEFSSSSKLLAQRGTEYYKNSTDECENAENSLSSARKVSRKKSAKVKEIFTRKAPIFESSSESEFGQNHEKQSDEVLSTGKSEITDEAYRFKDKTSDRPKDQTVNSKKSDVQWLTSKSIGKMVLGKGDTVRREQPDNTIRGRSPQRKLSNKQMNYNTKPYCLFVEELKRNSLIMKEDIFSSSKSKTHVISKNSILRDEKQVNEVREDIDQEEIEQLPIIEVENGILEVFEAKGCSERREKTAGFNEVQQPQLGYAPVMKKGQIQQTDSIEKTTLRNTSYISKNVELSQRPLTMKSIGINTNESTYSDSLTIGHNSNESRSSRIVTPTTTSSRYVKLPGFPEAFVRDDTYVKELRIKDGLSFESINMCTSSKTTHEPSQSKIRFMEENATDFPVDEAEPEQKQIQRLKEMKDESTDYELLLEHRLTQTSMIVEKRMADTSVQCESHIIDVVNDSIDYKNDHQEIMICNDHGKGVQLYNILGHPLTDMEGYLLKDSLGRFLVRFDNFGVPTTCTDGKTIFLEDGIKWEHVKGYLNIIHQRCKKNIANSPERRKIKNMIDHPAKRRPENVKTLRQQKQIRRTLKWQRDNSRSTLSDGNSSQRIFEIENVHNPLRQIKLKPDPVNTYGNTSTLVAEMKSIAKLRNALLEKINFIADHRDPPQKPRFSTMNETRSHKSMKKYVTLPKPPETNWKSEPGIQLDRNRKQKTSFKSVRNIKKRRDTGEDHLSSFFKNRTAPRHYSPRALPQCMQETQDMFPATTSGWHPETMAIMLPNDRWQQSPSSDGLTILRHENFPPVSETSSFVGPWSDVSQTNSNTESLNGQPIKWSAMRPSIEGDSEENGF